MSRTGKIARLPRPLQEELNRRLERNVPGSVLAAWLNADPEVQTVLRDYFDGEPISEQNITNWRAGGFGEWQHRQDYLGLLRDFSGDAAEVESALAPMAGHASRLISLQYAITMSAGETDTGLDLRRVAALKPLHDMTRAVTALRGLEQRDTRLELRKQELQLRARSRANAVSAPLRLDASISPRPRRSCLCQSSPPPPGFVG